ncbi:hypothetical protein GZL_08419 [Streptomyces sp. 769]|nr:hypothetical protein GZL_08419 [Streptomyces sp. 769]
MPPRSCNTRSGGGRRGLEPGSSDGHWCLLRAWVGIRSVRGVAVCGEGTARLARVFSAGGSAHGFNVTVVW